MYLGGEEEEKEEEEGWSVDGCRSLLARPPRACYVFAVKSGMLHFIQFYPSCHSNQEASRSGLQLALVLK